MKLGIVLEGGASRTYFSVGVLDALHDMGIKPDYLIGTSAGIANGISFVSGQRGRNIEIGLKYLPDKRYMGFKHLLNRKNKSFYNIDFVFNEIPNVHLPFDYDAFKNSGCETIAVLTNIKTGKCEYVSVTGDDPSWTSIVASCALPIFFPPIKLNGEIYMDGGITVAVPIEKAIEDGCDKIIVITTRERSYHKEHESGVKLGKMKYRKYPEFAKALDNRTATYNAAHQKVLDLEKEGKIVHIAPEVSTADWKRTERENSKIQMMYDEGYKTAMKYAETIKTYCS